MANHFSTCRIRLNSETNGTGFLIADGYVLTCTHVVQAAIKNPEVKITVSFQRSSDTSEIPATVPHFTPLDDDKAYRDIAVLALAKAPNDAKIMPLPRNHQSELAEHPFAACGFRHDIGEITTGIIAENENNSLMQLNFGDIPIVGGYSGAPVWAKRLDAVVGMCEFAGRNLFKEEWEEYFSLHSETWEDYVARGGTCPQYPVFESIRDYANPNN